MLLQNVEMILFCSALFNYQLNQSLTDMGAAVATQTYCPECDQYFRLYSLRQPALHTKTENKQSESEMFMVLHSKMWHYLLLLLITVIVTVVAV